MSATGILAAETPGTSLPRQRLEFARRYAALAPTEVNREAWELRLAGAALELIAKQDPTLERVDPDGRESMIGCGAALQYLKLALKNFGGLGRVELFPDLDQPRLVARIHAGKSSRSIPQQSVLFAAMTGSRAPSAPVDGKPETIMAALSEGAASDRGWLDFTQSEMSRRRVVQITLKSQQPGMAAGAGPTRSAGLWTGNPSRWSRPLFAFGARKIDVRRVAVETVRELSIPEATLAVVKTKTDDKQGWLEAGQTMARAVLHAKALGLSWAFVNQVCHREARVALRLGVGRKGFAQVILRFGSLPAGEPIRHAAPMPARATVSI